MHQYDALICEVFYQAASLGFDRKECSTPSYRFPSVFPHKGIRYRYPLSCEGARLRGFFYMKLYVGNIPHSMSEDELKQVFEACGNVVSAKIILDRDTGRSRGFGFVEMSNNDEGQNAISTFHGKEVNGRALTVNEARPQQPRSGSGMGMGRGDRDSRPPRNNMSQRW